MKKYLLPKEGNFYKANLHCHSIYSDGKLYPEEIKKIYKEKGYSIVAFTDHNMFIPHPELTDDTFLALHGIEMDIYSTDLYKIPFSLVRTCHLCCIALDPETRIQPLYHREKYFYPMFHKDSRSLVTYDENEPDYEREHCPECVNEVIKTYREKGFFVTYNHPVWSQENYSVYSQYKGMNAMEIFNWAGFRAGYDEATPSVYDDLLRLGNRISCIAADDNHNGGVPGSRSYDSFGGITYIKANSLKYKDVTDALVAGNTYATEAPEIYDLWIEGDTVHIECSPADKITLYTGVRRADVIYDEGEPLTSWDVKVRPEDVYVRLTVYDKTGKRAWTRAYFTDELFD